MVTETRFASPLARTAKAVEFLSPEQERELFARYRKTRDDHARNKLALAHLPLVIAEAKRLSGYQVSQEDLISEGNCGLIQAIDAFDPEKGVRLSTYARHWIRSAMLSFIIRNRNMMTIAASKTNVRLFFKLNAVRDALMAANNGQMPPAANTLIAQALEVPESAVETMICRLAGELSLDAPIKLNEGDETTLIENLPSPDPDPEKILLEKEKRETTAAIVESLPDRERRIITSRVYTDEEIVPRLKTLAAKEGITTARVHQIEKLALKKIRDAVIEE